jgi:hypothetical protein
MVHIATKIILEKYSSYGVTACRNNLVNKQVISLMAWSSAAMLGGVVLLV